MRVRRAEAADYDALAALWRELDHELPPPVHEGPADPEQELAEVAEILAAGLAFLAEDDGGAPVGFALAKRRSGDVQSDDLSAVEQAVRQFVPRLPGGSRGSLLAPPRNGWIAVYDDVCDRDPELLRRLARELSDRMGAVVCLLGVERDELVRMILLDRGSVLDEYLSVPEFYGPLPPGDVVGLAANPRVVSRLTGAAPDAVRRIARTADAPAELPPARELLAELAEAMGIEGVGHGWADAPELAGAVRVDRA